MAVKVLKDWGHITKTDIISLEKILIVKKSGMMSIT